MVFTQSLIIIFFSLNSWHTTEELSSLLAVAEAKEAIRHLYILRDTLGYGKQSRMSLYPECSEQHVCCSVASDIRYKLLPSLHLNFNIDTSWGYSLIAWFILNARYYIMEYFT